MDQHREYQETVACLVGLAIIPLEDPDVLEEGGDWYSKLFQMMDPTDRNNLQTSITNLHIITFNYDRSLDYFLRRCSDEIFSAEVQARNIHRYVDIFHFWGDLGNLGYDSPGPQYVISRPYETTLTKDTLGVVMRRLTFSKHGEIGSDEMVDQVIPLAKILDNAGTICFLGFGYQPQNLRFFQPFLDQLSHSKIIGTAKGLKQDRARVEKVIPNIKLGGEEETILQFLDRNEL